MGLEITNNVPVFAQAETFQIKKEDIVAGKQKSPASCPMAKAFRRSFPKCKKVRVHNSKVYFTDENGVDQTLCVDRILQREIINFDKTGKMKPRKVYFRNGGSPDTSPLRELTRP